PRHLFDIDALTGAVETFSYDEAAETFTIERQSQDLTPILERNKKLATSGYTKPRVAGEMDWRLAASVPIDVAYEWLQKHGVRAWDKNHLPAVKRLLNSNEYM